MFWTQPNCPRCGFEGPDFMYLSHFDWPFGVLVQDRESFRLRVVEVPDGDAALRLLDGVPAAEPESVWAAIVAGIADPPLTPTERVVPVREFFGLALGPVPMAGEFLCPECRSPLYWRGTGIS